MRLLKLLTAPAAVALAVLTVTAPVAAAPGPPRAEPAWKQVTRADFDGGSLPSGCGAYTGPHAGAPDSWYDAQQVHVDGGYLRLSLARRPSGDRTYATGGMGCWALARTYGKFDVRAKVPKGVGVNSFITLWPSAGGRESAMLTELLAPDPETAYFTVGDGKNTERGQVSGDYADGFHMYTIEWTPQGTRFLVDGQQAYRTSRTSAARRWLGIGVATEDGLAGRPDDLMLPVEFVVDWFMISSYAPGAAGAAVSGGAPSATPSATASVDNSPALVRTFEVLIPPKQPEPGSPVPWPAITLGLALSGLAYGLWQWDRVRTRRRRLDAVAAYEASLAKPADRPMARPADRPMARPADRTMDRPASTPPRLPTPAPRPPQPA